jgi:hypothetical protein
LALCSLFPLPPLSKVVGGLIRLASPCAQGILLSIASLSALYEPYRRLVLDASLLGPILSSLSHPTVGVRAAGCHCIRALSRSVNVLRTDLVEARAEESLVRLLREEENEVVKVTASAAVANLLLEFSPMRNVRRLCCFVPSVLSSHVEEALIRADCVRLAGPRRSGMYSSHVLAGGQVFERDVAAERALGASKRCVEIAFSLVVLLVGGADERNLLSSHYSNLRKRRRF